MNSEPEETFSRDLPEFPSVEEFPSMEHGLFHFPLGASAPAEGASTEHPVSDSPSPASLLIQHLASPLHFVNTHFNGHGRLVGASQAAVAQPAKQEEGGDEGEVTPEAPGPSRSLEALSEEIVSTAISTVVQNTLSALLRTTEAMEAPCMEEFMPTETPPCPMESTLESPVSITTTTTTAVTSAPHPHTAPLGMDEEEEEEEDVTGEASVEELPDVTLMAAEEEDFELLDQSELEMMDEGLGLSLDGQGVGTTASTTPDTLASADQHRQIS